MKARGFEELLVWHESKELVLMVYREFKSCKDYAFRDQVQRAAVSVMNNKVAFEEISEKCLNISRMIGGLIRKLNV